MTYLADRLSAVKPSASMAAKALRAKGFDVIDLGLGEPDFPMPPHIAEAAHVAALRGETLYAAAAETPALRAAVAEKFRGENGLDYGPGDIVVANGAKQIIFNALMATLNAADEAILPAPYFVSYPEMVKLLGGVPVMPICGAETALVAGLLNEAHVGSLAGAAHGVSPFFRISTAASDGVLTEAFARIVRAVAALEDAA